MTIAVAPAPADPAHDVRLQMLWLDITRTCQAQCSHCYNRSGPQGTAGEMTRADWLRVLDEAAGLGVRQVSVIGGEPLLHPDLADLVQHALDGGMDVEVFSNLIVVRKSLWPVLRQYGVTLATSYYSDDAAEHEAITKLRGSYRRTKANIARALRYRIPVRAGIIAVREGQRVEQAAAELRGLGVQRIGTDRLREIGRGTSTGSGTGRLSELCGNCARGRAAVLPSGEVAGCVMSGEMITAGNVRSMSLREIVTSPQWAELTAALAGCGDGGGCRPNTECAPDYECGPNGCVPQIVPRGGCLPDEDSCGPAPYDGRHRELAPRANAACVPDSCVPREDSCGPSPYAPGREPVLAGTTARNPDSDGSDRAPAQTPASAPAY